MFHEGKENRGGLMALPTKKTARHHNKAVLHPRQVNDSGKNGKTTD